MISDSSSARSIGTLKFGSRFPNFIASMKRVSWLRNVGISCPENTVMLAHFTVITERIIHLSQKLLELLFWIVFDVISKISCKIFYVFNNRICVVPALDQNAERS